MIITVFLGFRTVCQQRTNSLSNNFVTIVIKLFAFIFVEIYSMYSTGCGPQSLLDFRIFHWVWFIRFLDSVIFNWMWSIRVFWTLESRILQGTWIIRVSWTSKYSTGREPLKVCDCELKNIHQEVIRESFEDFRIFYWTWTFEGSWTQEYSSGCDSWQFCGLQKYTWLILAEFCWILNIRKHRRFVRSWLFNVNFFFWGGGLV